MRRPLLSICVCSEISKLPFSSYHVTIGTKEERERGRKKKFTSVFEDATGGHHANKSFFPPVAKGGRKEALMTPPSSSSPTLALQFLSFCLCGFFVSVLIMARVYRF